MQTNVYLNAVSDGQTYEINDQVKADTQGCEGCSACCQGVGDYITLTPFDVFEIKRATALSWEALLEKHLTLKLSDGMVQPFLSMEGVAERCAFLNENQRCSIHAYRPNICRLFPLGRVYEDDDFKYFLLQDACVKPKLEKIKVKKWIGIENYAENKRFLLDWYKVIKALAFRMKFVRDSEDQRAMYDLFLEGFYAFDTEDFYAEFYSRLPKVKSDLGIL
ncbi:MAG: hypothetical protein BGO41_00505 [Clostridiales bacterium 38-18]|nr:MAG: hypothetical protein BGO41_00505 [Clostridiales bacterium 38-18]